MVKKLIQILHWYDDEDVIGPLYIKLPPIITSVKCFESNKTKSFQISDNKLLKKYTQIWKKVENQFSIKFDSEPVYGDNDQYIKKKIKIYNDYVNTSFQGKKVPKKNVFIIISVSH